jgi:hypothetical protein
MQFTRQEGAIDFDLACIQVHFCEEEEILGRNYGALLG